MAEFPALPLFTDAYIADTRHLDAAQHGAYLLLLMTAWRTSTCRLPNDDKILSRYACMSLKTWMANKSIILSFWNIDGEGLLFQKRLIDERSWVELKRNRQSTAGIASALKRKNRGSTSVALGLQPNVNQNSTPTPTPTPTPIKVRKKPPSPLKGDDLINSVEPTEHERALQEFKAHRKGMKKPLTLQGEKRLKEKLNKLYTDGYDVISLLNEAMEKNWLTVYEPKEYP